MPTKILEIMKNLFSVLLLTIVMAGNLNAFEKENYLANNYDHCIDSARLMEVLAMTVGFSAAEAYEMGNNAFENCVDRENLSAAMYWQVN